MRPLPPPIDTDTFTDTFKVTHTAPGTGELMVYTDNDASRISVTLTPNKVLMKDASGAKIEGIRGIHDTLLDRNFIGGRKSRQV